LIDNGVRINLVSDWPGGYYKIVAKPLDPLTLIYMAVVRRHPGEPPDRAWHPEEGITVEEGLRAYTINPAMASHQEHLVGSISVGKLADIAVLSDNVLNGAPERLLATDVTMTILGGNIVYERDIE
jgi:predicted amidohydrolase YtcJ